MFIFAFLVFILYLGYIIKQSTFFITNLNKLIAIFNLYISNIMSTSINDNTTIGDFVAVNADLPKTRIGKIMYAKTIMSNTNSSLLYGIYCYILLVGLCLFTLLVLIVVKPSLLSHLGPKGQELKDKIAKHKILKLELNLILNPLKKQKQDLIDMSTEGYSFIYSYRHSLSIWKLINRMDSLMARAQANMIRDMLTSNKIIKFKSLSTKYILYIYITSTIVSSVLNMGIGIYINLFAQQSFFIVKLLTTFVIVLNILVGCIIMLVTPILFALTILHLCNCVYNYKLIIIKNSPANFRSTAKNIGILIRENGPMYIIPVIGLATHYMGYETAKSNERAQNRADLISLRDSLTSIRNQENIINQHRDPNHLAETFRNSDNPALKAAQELIDKETLKRTGTMYSQVKKTN